MLGNLGFLKRILKGKAKFFKKLKYGPCPDEKCELMSRPYFNLNVFLDSANSAKLQKTTQH